VESDRLREILLVFGELGKIGEGTWIGSGSGALAVSRSLFGIYLVWMIVLCFALVIKCDACVTRLWRNFLEIFLLVGRLARFNQRLNPSEL